MVCDLQSTNKSNPFHTLFIIHVLSKENHKGPCLVYHITSFLDWLLGKYIKQVWRGSVNVCWTEARKYLLTTLKN